MLTDWQWSLQTKNINFSLNQTSVCPGGALQKKCSRKLRWTYCRRFFPCWVVRCPTRVYAKCGHHRLLPHYSVDKFEKYVKIRLSCQTVPRNARWTSVFSSIAHKRPSTLLRQPISSTFGPQSVCATWYVEMGNRKKNSFCGRNFFAVTKKIAKRANLKKTAAGIFFADLGRCFSKFEKKAFLCFV